MAENNWVKLEEEIIANRNQDKSEMIKQSLQQTTGFLKFLGDLVELFFPSMIKSLLGISEQQKKPEK